MYLSSDESGGTEFKFRLTMPQSAYVISAGLGHDMNLNSLQRLISSKGIVINGPACDVQERLSDARTHRHGGRHRAGPVVEAAARLRASMTCALRPRITLAALGKGRGGRSRSNRPWHQRSRAPGSGWHTPGAPPVCRLLGRGPGAIRSAVRQERPYQPRLLVRQRGGRPVRPPAR